MVMEEKTMTVPEAAERLGISGRRVRKLIEDNRLPAKQYGRDWIIKADDLKLVRVRKVGRPPKTASK